MAAHRYWRVYCNNGQSGTHFDIKEIELRTSIGGADATAPTGTFSASSQSAGFEANKAFDNDTGTTWYTPASNLPAWIKVDFGAGNEKDIVEIALMAWSLSEMVCDFELQWSDDNSTWTTLYHVLNSDWSTTTFTAFSASNHPRMGAASKQFWRLRATAVNGGSVFGLAELEMYTGPASVNSCTGGSGHASSRLEVTGPASEAFDGIKSDGGNLLGNYWSAVKVANEWVGYRFAGAVEVAIIGITARVSTAVNQAPKDFVLEYWNGSAYVTAFSITNQTAWGAAETRYFSSAGLVSAPTAPTTNRVQVCACT